MTGNGATSMRIKFKNESSGDKNTQSISTGKGKKILLKSKRSKYLEMESEDDSSLSLDEEEVLSVLKLGKYQDVQSGTSQSKPRDRKRVRNNNSNASSSSLRRNVRQKIFESFYTVELRNSIFTNTLSTSLAACTQVRRSSSRLSYAFGQRVPEIILNQQSEFELYGGGTGEKLEDMVLRRTRNLAGNDNFSEENAGEATRVFGGVVVPASSFFAMSKGPILMTTTTPSIATAITNPILSDSSLSSASPTPEVESDTEMNDVQAENEDGLEDELDELEDQMEYEEVKQVLVPSTVESSTLISLPQGRRHSARVDNAL